MPRRRDAILAGAAVLLAAAAILHLAGCKARKQPNAADDVRARGEDLNARMDRIAAEARARQAAEQPAADAEPDQATPQPEPDPPRDPAATDPDEPDPAASTPDGG